MKIEIRFYYDTPTNDIWDLEVWVNRCQGAIPGLLRQIQKGFAEDGHYWVECDPIFFSFWIIPIL